MKKYLGANDESFGIIRKINSGDDQIVNYDYDESMYTVLNGKVYIKFSYLLLNRKNVIIYEDKGLYRTIGVPIIYFIDYNNKNEYIIIPPNFLFDFNSSPKLFHFVIDKDEFISALIHDYLYSNYKYNINKQGVYHNGVVYIKEYESMSNDSILNGVTHLERKHGVNICLLTRKGADLIWKRNAFMEERMRKGRVGLLKSLKIYSGYIGLRLFGFINYK